MSKILIVYGTRHGQTEKIANFIANKLQADGYSTDIFDAQSIPEQLDLIQYEAFLVGAPIHAGGYPKKVKNWVKLNSHKLSQKPSAFFSVCLGILQKDERVQKEEREFLQKFFSWSGWKPNGWAIFPGALSYSQYNWLLKLIMKRIAKKAGVETETNRDYEYTNWSEVSRFTERLMFQLDPHNKFRDACVGKDAK